MSNIVDRVFNEVCLDERITDGIFRMEEETHMDALRDYFVKKGLPKEAAIHVTNRMVEGKYPDRQAYRKEDGILVTWPSAKHKHKAMQENPGKYVEYNPFPKSAAEQEPKPEKEDPRKEREKDVEPKKEPEDDKEDDIKSSGGRGGSNLFGGDKVTQGDKQLDVEPLRGDEKPEPPAIPVSPTPPPAPRTPQRVAAEKEVVKQIMQTDDTALTNVTNPLNMSEACRQQLNELYKKADELGFKDAVTFLTRFVKP